MKYVNWGLWSECAPEEELKMDKEKKSRTPMGLTTEVLYVEFKDFSRYFWWENPVAENEGSHREVE